MNILYCEITGLSIYPVCYLLILYSLSLQYLNTGLYVYVCELLIYISGRVIYAAAALGEGEADGTGASLGHSSSSAGLYTSRIYALETYRSKLSPSPLL